ncbi:VOC family protein [Pandoraea pulmonicola]|uniref:Biphenyl-2,3-diol 1,2-dioxygenase 2 n=1 Tax=Pandoraea pulmonicola TaxID=93221 RepID=A0AAJ5D2N2_PANPU|nr:VOC family protein [Pandoraea pulmonicola]APD13567.1 hypothetical protein RO07_25550 [Pandoraea pulmonicola]SUA92795.1 Biphenyl-2,3-diol 1,2-dioxygenase 2 [Pandoraea pulmonicola]
MNEKVEANADALRALSGSTRSMPGVRIAEVVLQTSNYDALRSWYEAVLGREWSIVNTPSKDKEIQNKHGDGGKQVHASDVRSSFMFLDRSLPYGQMFAIFEISSVGKMPTNDPGLNHMQFKHVNLEALIERVKALRDAGLHPHRSANHGPVTSFYFRDPDQNVVELCSNNYDTEEAFFGYFKTEAFRSNPSGIDIDRDAFIARYDSGETKEQLVRIA